MHNVRSTGSVVGRLMSVVTCLLLVVVTASAYTVVMRGGRRIEIPSRFVVTPSTLTYEVEPGIQVTLQMAAIDVQATEKANNESPGSLVNRIEKTVASQNAVVRRSARITITNRDLEQTTRRRVSSEQAYEKRLKELGLPSLAESKKQAEAESAIAQRDLHDRLAAEKQSEEYWRGRATELRTEMSALDAEIRYVRGRLDEVPYPSWSGSFTPWSGIAPFISFGNIGTRGHFSGVRGHRPNVFTSPVRPGPQLSGRVGFGNGMTRGQVLINPGQVNHRPGGRVHGGGWSGRNTGLGVSVGILPTATVFGSSALYDYSYERSELITRFNDLATTRAGLNARWRELEEEARRAGAPPGWLRR